MDEARIWWNADEWLCAYYALALREFKQTLKPTLSFFPLLLRKTSSSEILKDRYGTDPSIEYCVDIILSALELLPKTRFCQPWHWTSRTKNTYILGISISSGWLCPCREVFHFVTSKFSNATLLLYCLYHHVVPYHSLCSMAQVTWYL